MSFRAIKEEFAKMLEKHDWYYDYSDDHRVFLRGSKQRQEILDFIDDNAEYEEELTEMFMEADPFNNNKTII